MVQANLGPQAALAQRVANLERWQQQMATSPILLNASTGTGGSDPGITIDKNGVHAFNASGVNLVGMLTSDGSITAYDTSGNPVVRLGPLTQSNPGHYGLEVYFNGSWAQVGAGNVDWANISNKPTSFTPSAHASTHGNGGSDRVTIDGSQVTSGQVPSSAQGDGSAYGFNHAVQGTSFIAAWIGNDSGNHFGSNTSTIRSKRNVRRHRIHPDRVLALKPVVYERPANGDYVEYGLIAEQVAETMPELCLWMNGQIHSVRYDLVGVALLDIVRELSERVDELEQNQKPWKTPSRKAKPWHEPEIRANNPPPFPEELLPYDIRED